MFDAGATRFASTLFFKFSTATSYFKSFFPFVFLAMMLHSRWCFCGTYSSEASIKISAADIDVVIQELEVTNEEARAALLKGHGDVVQALRHLLQLQQ